MVKRTGPTNKQLNGLLIEIEKSLRKSKSAFWMRIYDELSRSSRRRRSVNLGKIDKYSKADEIVVVPGKVLGSGDLSHNVTVAAWSFTDKAKEKINKNGKVLSLNELLKNNPTGKGVRLLG